MSVMKLTDSHFASIRTKLCDLFRGGEPATGVRQCDILAALSNRPNYLEKVAEDLYAKGRFDTEKHASEAIQAVTPPHSTTGVSRYAHERPTQAFISEFVDDLRRLNARAHARRYDNSEYSRPGHLPNPLAGKSLSDVELFKALQSVRYNADEGRTAENGRDDRLQGAWDLLSSLLPIVAEKAVTQTDEYNAAAWGIEPDTVAA